jgi:hypothetical protein
MQLLRSRLTAEPSSPRRELPTRREDAAENDSQTLKIHCGFIARY